MMSGLPTIDGAHPYDTCIVTKQRRMPFPVKAKHRTLTPLELVHVDLYKPITPATSGGRRFFLLDDATRYM
jgi:hypothetical protein